MAKLALSLLLLIVLAFPAQTPQPIVAGPEAAKNTVTSLFDAFGKDATLVQRWGLGALIRYQGKTILFDAGSNADVFAQNVRRLGVDLTKVDFAVVSHAHYDHLNGIDYLLSVNPKVKIYFPNDNFWGAPDVFNATGPDSLVRDSLPRHMQYFNGSSTKFPVKQSGRFWKANVEFVKESKEILPGITMVATSAQYMGYFSRYPNKSFVEGAFARQDCSDYKHNPLPELSLSLRTEQGEALFVGCSHTGVEKIIEQTLKQTDNRVNLVYGGFHLIPFNRPEIVKLANYLKDDLKVKQVAPGHCTGHLAFKVLSDLYQDNYLYAGVGETIPF